MSVAPEAATQDCMVVGTLVTGYYVIGTGEFYTGRLSPVFSTRAAASAWLAKR